MSQGPRGPHGPYGLDNPHPDWQANPDEYYIHGRGKCRNRTVGGGGQVASNLRLAMPQLFGRSVYVRANSQDPALSERVVILPEGGKPATYAKLAKEGRRSRFGAECPQGET